MSSFTFIVTVDDEDDDLIRRNVVRLESYIYKDIAKRAGLVVPPDYQIDHIDNDSLNNRRDNLRAITAAQNTQKRGTPRNNTSGFRGVSLFRYGRYKASIRVDGHSIHLGYHSTPEEAARAYDRAAKEHFGAFAVLNFKEPT